MSPSRSAAAAFRYPWARLSTCFGAVPLSKRSATFCGPQNVGEPFETSEILAQVLQSTRCCPRAEHATGAKSNLILPPSSTRQFQGTSDVCRLAGLAPLAKVVTLPARLTRPARFHLLDYTEHLLESAAESHP